MYICSNRPVASLTNLVFLDRICTALRQATEDIAREDLPDDIKHLLQQLERQDKEEAIAPTKHD